MDVKGRKIVIIGGSSGIGEAVTRNLAQNGASLIITGRNNDTLQKLQSQIENIESTAVFDFTDEDSVKSFFDSLAEFDDLVIVASGSPTTCKFLHKNSLSHIDDFIRQKLWGNLYSAYYGIPKLKEKGSVTIFIGLAGRKAFPECTPLSITNNAIVGMAKNIAVEINPKRINVVNLAVVPTHAWNYMPEKERASFFKACAAQNPLGRLATPDDVADAVLFLVASKYVNGIVLDVVGGETIDFMH